MDSDPELHQKITNCLELLTKVRVDGKVRDVGIILEGITRALEGHQRDPSLEKFTQERICLPMCNFIENLQEFEFNVFQTGLLDYVIFNWPKKENRSFHTLILVADLYCFITCRAPRDVVDEYLSMFSRSSMPPQIKYFIYPAILKQSQLDCAGVALKSSEYFVDRFAMLRVSSKENLTREAEDFIKLFWKRLGGNWKSSMAPSVLPICLTMVQLIHMFSTDLISLVVSVVHDKILQEPVSSHQILAAAVIIIGLQRTSWKVSPTWDKVGSICANLAARCLKSKSEAPEINFAMKCVSNFLDEVDVESEDMAEKLATLVQKEFQSAQETKPEPVVSADQVLSSNSKSNCEREVDSKSRSPTRFLEALEKFVDKARSRQLMFSSADRAKLNGIISQLKDLGA